ncbi:MAG: hypothetical protein ACYC9S_13475 [Leptospirales bacterium]
MKRRRVMIDDCEVSPELLPALPVRSLVQEIVQKHLPDDRVVVEILVDGCPVFNDGQYGEGELPEGKEIRVVTGSLEDILRESMRTLVSHLSQVARLFSEIGRELRKGKIEEVFGGEGLYKEKGGPYVQGIEAMMTAQILVDQIRTIRGSGMSPVSGENLVLIEEESKFEELLQGMLVAQESQDWILLADLIEYELVPIFEKGLASAEQYFQTTSTVAIR